MHRTTFARIWSVFTILASLGLVSLSLSACGGEGGDIEFPSVTPQLPDLSNAGEISGTISFEGETPRRRSLPVQDAYCGSMRQKLDRPAYSESVLVTDGRVQNVLVYISKGLESYTFDNVKDEVEIDQELCVFIPHVLGVRTWQPVSFRNSDKTVHNVNTRNARNSENRVVLSMAPRKDDRKVRQFKAAETMIPVRCDMHSQMLMYISVFPHPYFTVSSADGTFRLPQVPPGEYVLTAHHERMGQQSRSVIVGPQGLVQADFSFRLE